MPGSLTNATISPRWRLKLAVPCMTACTDSEPSAQMSPSISLG